ncbi:MAG: SusD/RagB family nutrient-binding outer membrane lipoprotein [Niabella sp.]|nr:SusD/RagB family nutrient-binding outer membrane lipoprotein [Niabella sp.]
MKTITYITGSWLFITLMITGCTKNFDKINEPKGVLPEENIGPSTVGQAFAYAQYYGLGAFYVQVEENLHGHIYAQYFTSVPANFSTERFVPNGAWVNLFWNEFYAKSALMLLTTEKVTAQYKMTVANAMAKVWRVVMYHRKTDYFGPIIYSNYGNAQKSVKYDAQKDIYYDFFKTLDEAVAVFKSNPGSNAFGTIDQVYSGKTDSWLKFANSLRLRLAMRIAYVDPQKAKTEAEKAVADGVILVNADNAAVSSTINNVNILSRITYLTDFRASTGLLSALKGYNDPRLPVYYSPAATGGGYTALRNGLPASDRGTAVAPLTSFAGPKWIGNPPRAGTLVPNRVIGAAEVAFLRAEGALRGWNMGGTAKDLYNSGIRLSLLENIPSIATGDADAYVNSTNTPAAINDKWNSPAMSNIQVLYDASGSFEKQLEQIITQKWLAIYPDGYEAWAERRRTGYPRGYALLGSDNPDLKPTDLARRVIYPPVEITTNKAAYDEAVSLLGGTDDAKTRLWWDKKPLTDYPVPTQ